MAIVTDYSGCICDYHTEFYWNNTWKILSEFFVEIGCSKDNENSINAIDYLSSQLGNLQISTELTGKDILV